MSSSTSFADFPTEILCEIARRTDGKTLLALRKTCRTLHYITKIQVVWSSIVQELEAQPGASNVEKPRTECTAQELESWALERLRVRGLYESLSRSIPTHPLCYEFSFPEEVTECYLLPGGKRLLVFTRPRGTVYQCDLGLPTKCIQELIPGRCYNDEAVEDDVRHAIWIDKTQSRLTFRVALYSRFWCSEKGTTYATLYYVSLSSSGTQLEATPLITFPLSQRGVKLSAALDQSNFYLISKDSNSPRSELSIYTYTRPWSPCIRASLITDVIIKARLLHKNRFLVVCKNTFKIYDLSALQVNEQENTYDLEPWWQLPQSIQLRRKQFIEPIITPNYTRLAFATDGAGILGLSIPHCQQSIPWICPLALEIDRDLLYCSGAMGYLGSIFLDWRSRVHILRYSWDKPPRSSRKSFDEEFLLFNSEFNMAVDKIVGLSEERGRIVLQTDRRNVAIIDLLPT